MRTDHEARIRALMNDAEQAHAAGDVLRMIQVLDDAAAQGVKHPALFRTAAATLRNNGRIAEAGQILNRALALAPNDAATITQVGRLFVDESRMPEAISAFRAAIRVQPDYLDAWNALAAALAGERQFEAASAAFQRVASLSPSNPDPLAGMSLIELRRGHLDAARDLASAALLLDQTHPLALLNMVRIEVEARDFVSARAKLEQLLSGNSLNPEQRQTALRLLGDTLDGLGLVDDAFAAYGRVKRAFAEQNAPRFGAGGAVESHLEFIQRLGAWFDRQDLAGWATTSQVSTAPARRHVFLFGYLRSGVTLVESILASLPETRVLEEADTLRAADNLFLRNDGTLSRLNPLDAAAAATAREAYWNRVRERVPDVDDTIFVDMSPLYGIKLPMIARLFPDAICVVCRRDPRDVVLSCFRRNFKANALTYQLTSLEGIARHYDLAQQLTERHLATLPMPSHVIEYSHLVNDFDAATRELADFVGAEWTEHVRNFSTTASTLPISTPSAMQVRRSLFDGGGQWRRYRNQLHSILPVLQPWLEKFGYAE